MMHFPPFPKTKRKLNESPDSSHNSLEVVHCYSSGVTIASGPGGLVQFDQRDAREEIFLVTGREQELFVIHLIQVQRREEATMSKYLARVDTPPHLIRRISSAASPRRASTEHNRTDEKKLSPGCQ